MSGNFALVILSCDKYSDTWKPFFQCLSLFWTSKIGQTYLVTNELTDNELDDVVTIKTGIELSWSSKVRKAIDSIEEEFILVMLDDYFLIEKINNIVIQGLLKLSEINHIDYLSLIPTRRKIKMLNGISIISEKNLYGKTLQPAIWRKDYLKKCLYNDDFSAWEFENRQKIRSKTKIVGLDCCTNKAEIKFVNGVLQGKWYPSSLRIMSKLNIRIDLSRRNQLPIMSVIKYRLRVVLAKLIPVFIIRKSRKLLEKMGFKFITTGEK